MRLILFIHLAALLLEFMPPRAQALGVADGQPINAAVTNAAFMYKNIVEMTASADSSSTGSSQSITLGNPFTEFTNASLASIQNLTYANKSAAAQVVLKNSTGSTLTLINNSGGTAANRILTGTGANFGIATGGTVTLFYDTINSRWQLIASRPMAGSSIVTATSTTKTMGSSGIWIDFAGTTSSITLTVGRWLLFGSVLFDNDTTAPVWTQAGTMWSAADGADTGTAPAALSTVTNLTVLSVMKASGASTWVEPGTGIGQTEYVSATQVLVSCASSCVVYLSAFGSFSGTASHTRVTAHANGMLMSTVP